MLMETKSNSKSTLDELWDALSRKPATVLSGDEKGRLSSLMLLRTTIGGSHVRSVGVQATRDNS